METDQLREPMPLLHKSSCFWQFCGLLFLPPASLFNSTCKTIYIHNNLLVFCFSEKCYGHPKWKTHSFVRFNVLGKQSNSLICCPKVSQLCSSLLWLICLTLYVTDWGLPVIKLFTCACIPEASKSKRNYFQRPGDSWNYKALSYPNTLE